VVAFVGSGCGFSQDWSFSTDTGSVVFSGGLFRGIWIGGFLGLVALSGDIGVDRDVKMLNSSSLTFHFRRFAIFLRRMVHYPRLKEAQEKECSRTVFGVSLPR
jgi:hypothetical protein